ncbi:MAG TPA: hypothetical protein DEO84_12265 [candidate division Zixibacteria bacterium]|jgi:hypothetical protein|nr:hypothetical protein [candidate division Zixibacteria bacterium]HBZ02083.1 hypothetical protein [candidate division Zixibacteria bacterium]
MEYLFQFQVDADDVKYDVPLIFHYKNIEIALYLYEKKWISSGKKIHFTVMAETWKDALKIIWDNRTEFNHRLMFLTNEAIIMGFYPEFIMENQFGKKIRNIHFWDLHLKTEHYFNPSYIGITDDRFGQVVDDFLSQDIKESDFLAMGFYNEALQSNLPTEQLRTLYLALEELIGGDASSKRCPECGARLNPRASNQQIDDFFSQQIEDSAIFGTCDYPKAAELRQLRGKLSHPPNKRGIVNNRDLTENIKVLSRLIRCHLETKYGLDYTAYAVAKPWGTLMDFNAKFNTEKKEERFALDIPPLQEYIDRVTSSRWILNEE